MKTNLNSSDERLRRELFESDECLGRELIEEAFDEYFETQMRTYYASIGVMLPTDEEDIF